jgi:hypothetical protein
MKTLALALMVSCPLFAAPILQNNWNNSHQVQAFTPMGQSFTAEDATLESIGVFAMTFNPHHPFGSLTFNLFEGGGFDGTLLGTAIVDPAAGSNGWTDADFGSLNLVIGQLYTFQIASTNGSAYWGVQTNERFGVNDYAGGSLFLNGSAVSGDFRFRVTPGVDPLPEAVPEPGSFVLLGLGSLSLLALRRRRRD